MSDDVLISVVIPVFNSSEYLSDCLESVSGQIMSDEDRDCDAIEIICVDDASTDSSLEILRIFERKYKNIQVISYENNRGQAYARNVGLEESRGEYIFFMDSDDRLSRAESLRIMYDTAKQNDTDCLIFDAEMTGVYGEVAYANRLLHCDVQPGLHLNGSFVKWLTRLEGGCLTVWCQFWRRKFLIDRSIRFCESASPHEDLLFSFVALSQVERLFYYPTVLYLYQFRQKSVSRNGYSEKRIHAYWNCYKMGLKYMQQRRETDSNLSLLQVFLIHIRNAVNDLVINMICCDKAEQIVWEEGLERVIFETMLIGKYKYLSRIITSEEYHILKDKRVIIYGAGKVSQSIQHMLDDFGIADYSIAETRPDERSMHMKISSCCKDIDNTALIVAAGEKNKKEMIKNAESLGFKTIMSYN